MKTVKTKVAGVTKTNDDGRSRQALIRKYVKRNEVLLLEREPGNRYDKNAIGVHVAPDEYLDQDTKIGYISSDLAADLAPLMDSGHRITCSVLNKTGGKDGKSYGVNIHLTIYTPDEVAEHNRQKVQSKPVAARVPEKAPLVQDEKKPTRILDAIAGIFSKRK